MHVSQGMVSSTPGEKVVMDAWDMEIVKIRLVLNWYVWSTDNYDDSTPAGCVLC